MALLTPFAPVRTSELNKVSDIPTISPFGMLILEICEPLVLSRNFCESLKFRPTQKAFRSIERKFLFGHSDFLKAMNPL